MKLSKLYANSILLEFYILLYYQHQWTDFNISFFDSFIPFVLWHMQVTLACNTF